MGIIGGTLFLGCVAVQAQLNYDATYSVSAINARSYFGFVVPGAQLTTSGSSINGTDTAGIILGVDPDVYATGVGIGSGGWKC